MMAQLACVTKCYETEIIFKLSNGKRGYKGNCSKTVEIYPNLCRLIVQ